MLYLFKNTWQYAQEDRWKLFICYVLHIISFLGLLLQPYAFGMAVNSLQINGITYLRPSILWLGLYFAGFVIFQIFHRSGRYFEISTAARNQQRFMDAIYTKLCHLPMQWHVEHHSGVVVNRIKLAGEALNDFGCNQSSFLEHAFLSVGPIFILSGIDIRITGVSLLLISITLLAAFRMNKIIQGILDKKTGAYHTLAGKLSDFAGNIRTVIVLRLGPQTKAELDNRFEPYYRQTMREHNVNQVRCFVLDAGAILIEFTALFQYIWSCRSESVFLIGNLVMIITYLRQMRDAVFQVASSFYDTMRWQSALKSGSLILEENLQSGQWGQKEASMLWKSLFIKHLEFAYGNNQFRLSISDLVLAENSKVAVVGASGSGKSTLLYLLSGLYNPASLEAFTDDGRHTDMSCFSDEVCLIAQDTEVFENTILYNITFGMEPEEPELNKAIDCAGFREVIERLPAGIDTDIREKGVNLSGGEKQRLALARGLYHARSKKLLLLDEITSSVDAANERSIMKAILANDRRQCILCNIHRLHLLDMFDTILVMERGQIVEKGSFSELLHSGRYFKALWNKYQTEESKKETKNSM